MNNLHWGDLTKDDELERGTTVTREELEITNPEEMLAKLDDLILNLLMQVGYDEYMRGFYNGLIRARAELLNIEPEYIDNVSDYDALIRYGWRKYNQQEK